MVSGDRPAAASSAPRPGSRRWILVVASLVATGLAIAAAILLVRQQTRRPAPPEPTEASLDVFGAGAAASSAEVVVTDEESREPRAGSVGDATAGEERDPTLGLRLGERMVRDPEALGGVGAGPSLAPPSPLLPPAPSPGAPFAESPAKSSPARLLELPRPAYPPIARARRLEATVQLRVRVGADGRVLEAALAGRPAGYGFDEAARRAALGARYEPALFDGRPAESTATLTIRFTLARLGAR